MSPSRRAGFTMIEIIIAMAVAIILLTAVHSTVQAMTRTAQRIQDEHAEQARLQRFIEILRRDLQGWYEKSESARPNSNASADEAHPFLRFTTTADSLAASGTSNSMRSGEVQYILRRTGATTEVIRRESSSESGAEFVIWSTRQIFTVEFQKNNEWIAEWAAKERPSCLRIAFATRVMTLTP